MRVFQIMHILILFSVSAGFVNANNTPFNARVHSHDQIELFWSDDAVQGREVVGFSIERASAESPIGLRREGLTFEPYALRGPEARSHLFRLDRACESAIQIFRFKVIENGLEHELGLAGVMMIRRPERIIPMPFEPSEPTVAEALSDIWRSGMKLYRYFDRQELTGDDPVRAGMVFYVEEPLSPEIVLAGAIKAEASFHFPAGELTGFCYPLLSGPVPFSRFIVQVPELEGMIVYYDGNMLPLEADQQLASGWHIYAFRSSHTFEYDLPAGELSIDLGTYQPKPVVSEPPRVRRPKGRDTSVRIVYDPTYETARYKCWDNGYSGPWDGITDQYPGVDEVVNAGVVRRGRIVYVTDTGIMSATPVTVWGPIPPKAIRPICSYQVGWSEEKQAATVTVPADAPIGDYRIQVGTDPQNFCTMYVLFDTALFAQSQGGPFTPTEMASWAYEDIAYTGTQRDGYGSLFDYLNYQYWGPTSGPGSSSIYGYRGATDAELGRDGGLYGQRTVELFASIHGWGASTPLEAAIHCYEIIGQRITWTMQPYYGCENGYYNYHDRVFAGEQIRSISGSYQASELDVNTAEKAALGLGFVNRFPAAYVYNCGQCMNFGALLAQAFRSIGIPATMHYAAGGGGWLWSFHVWTNAAFLETTWTPQSWGGRWFKFDACDTYTSSSAAHLEGHIGPVVFDGFGDYLLNTFEYRDGPGYRGRYELNESFSGDYYASHLDSLLKTVTIADPQGDELYLSVNQSSCPFEVYDSFADASGTAQSTYSYVRPGHHGYALNDTQWRHYGQAYDPGLDESENLPTIEPGQVVEGVIGGWGTAWYRLEPRDQDTIELTVIQGEDRIKLYGRWDQPITSTQSRHNGLLFDIGPTTSINIPVTGSRLYILVQGENGDGQPLGSQHVSYFTLQRADFNDVPILSPAGFLLVLILTGYVLRRRERHDRSGPA